MSRLLLLVVVSVAGLLVWMFTAFRADSRPDAAPIASSIGVTPLVARTQLAPIADKPDSTPPGWVMAPPAAVTGSQSSEVLTACQTADPGFGSYEGWDDLPEGQMLRPKTPAHDAKGNPRVVFHFHGHEAVRKEWVQFTSEVVLVALDLGNSSSAYGDAFADPSRFEALLEQTQRVLEQRLGHTVAIERFVLSAWSAGYAAVRAILNSEYQSRVEGVVLLDGLHTSTLESAAGRDEVTPFVDFARRAAQDEVLMFVSHSSINPPDYISTTQATSYLIWNLGGSPREEATIVAPGLTSYRRFDRGGFHAMGFPGATKEDHCAQVALYGHVLQTHLLPRWGLVSRRDASADPAKD